MKHDKNEPMLGLSPAQVAGSALAAVSGALLASFAGTAGTIIGTAVASVVATVGAAIYTASLRRTSDAVRRTAAQVRQNALINLPRPRTVREGPMRSRDEGGSDDAPDSDGEPASTPPDDDSDIGRVPWGKVLLASAAVTVAALAGITTFEAVSGQPLSSLVGGDSSQGTTVGNVVGSDHKSSKNPKPSDQTTPTDEATPTPSPGSDSSKAPDTPVPSDTPAPGQTGPSDQPSTAPQGAPAPSPAP